MTFVRIICLVFLFIGGSVLPVQAAGNGTRSHPQTSRRITVISGIDEGHGPARYGLRRLEQALTIQNILVTCSTEPHEEMSDSYVLAGLSSEACLATEHLGRLKLTLPKEKEALLVKKTSYRGKPAIVLCGADEVGLMYAALDVAKRISWSQDSSNPFKHITDAMEKPDVKERAVSTGTFHRRYFEQRLHDAEYWKAYFDMMAEHRLNQFLLIFGYKNNQYRAPNFTAPVYPNFFDLEDYPYIRLVGMTSEQQETNTAALKTIITLAHERGIEFGVGLWDQIERDGRYLRMTRDDVEVPVDALDNIIWGLSKKNLIPYTKSALRKFLQTFPDIDLVQFRMHWEAGITGEVALKFWKEIFGIVKEECPSIKIEARAKDVPDETLYDGVATGLDFRVATKYWMEQMGMPFHPTHINKPNQHDRRHGYADLLRYPQRYGFKWRVWNGGTTRALLWGDPEWVRLFAEGSHLYRSAGYEFNEPLYFKMNGSPHEAPVTPLLNPEFCYYRYEFERYWHLYQVFGRIGYNFQASSDIWEMEFQQRFGQAAGLQLMQGLHLASRVLPRIVSASYLYPRFSSPQGWPELQRMEDLGHFATKSRPSDIQQFASPMEEAEWILSGGTSPRRLPSQTSRWFKDTATGILAHVEKAEAALGDPWSREVVSTLTDLKILAQLSMYHSGRLAAAVKYALYEKTGDLASFDQALVLETEAVAAYGRLVEAAGNIYNSQLDFGSNRDLFPGHWSKEYERLQNELTELRASRGDIEVRQTGQLIHIPVRRKKLQERIRIVATSTAQEGRIMFAMGEGAFGPTSMQPSAAGLLSGTIPNPGVEGEIRYYLEVSDESGGTKRVPEQGSEAPHVIKIGDDHEPPRTEIDRIETAKLNSEITVTARVTDPAGIESVVLRFRRVSQFADYQALPMTRAAGSDQYEAVIPAAYSDGKYDVMYFVEVMDKQGNGRMVPDMEEETPYVIVRLDRGRTSGQGVESVAINADMDVPAIAFAVGDIQQVLAKRGDKGRILPLSQLSESMAPIQIVVGLANDKTLLKRLEAAGGRSPGELSPEGYVLRLTRQAEQLAVWALGADAAGAMYAGLVVAETIGQSGIADIQESDCKPHIAKRGLKINVPLDARTPAYADCGDAAQKNMAVMWDLDFWKAHLDQMARCRYNMITMWNGHPFPSMVKVPDYPDVALDDVKIADIDWREWFPKNAGRGGSRGVTQDILDNLKTVKKMTMDEKIAFWQAVMQYGRDRGIEFHIITWNIFVWGTDGKHGITHDVDNEVTIDYLRKSVRSLFETYPLLAGIGVTAGERMPRLTPDEKENWLWKTYGLGVMDAKKAFPGRSIRFIHRYWMSKIPDITKHFEGFDEDITFNFSYKYVKARLYAHTHPTFADKVLEGAPAGTKWWWNLRNDDIFYFRWGDPDYVRDFILNFPPAEQTEGFHMGSDGYVWGREFVSNDPETPRQLEIDKHWYKFMLWGRLGYDPSLSNPFFKRAMQQQFPGQRVDVLFDVWTRASRIIPAVNRFHWHDWDFQWAVEACQGRNGYHAVTDHCWKPGGTEVADEIQSHAEFVLERLPRLNSRTANKAWRETVVDLEAMSYLGLYYAAKIRAADTKDDQPRHAIEHLKKAAAHWKHYAETGQKQYKSQLLSKGGWADWQQGYENALKDIVLLGGGIDELQKKTR